MAKNPVTELVTMYREKKIKKYDYIDKMHSFNKTLFYLSERLPQTDIKKIELQDDNLRFTTRKDNLILTFNGKDRRGVPYDILNFGTYEQEDETVLFNLLTDDALILDVGANIGWYSLLFSKRLKHAKIYAFEPIEDTYDFLIQNISLNHASNISPFNIALSDIEGTASFYYFPEGSVLASEKNLIECAKARQVVCNTQTLDNFVDEQNIEKIDLIKCDVEGGELSVIKGGIKSIEKFLPIIFMELFERWSVQFNYHPNDVIQILREHGYQCFLVNEDKLEVCNEYRESEEERLNFFFLHKEKHGELIAANS